jgi:peptidoglycan/xylan/chitin deacetylase (PgdA/CDA1 family)
VKAVMYHYVRAEAGGPFFRYLHLDDFRAQLRHFAATFGVLGRDQFLQAVRTGRTAPGVVFTFDDGVADHHQHVLPVLRELGMWGIFYVPTGIYRTPRRVLDVHRIHLLLGAVAPEALLAELRALLRDDMLIDDGVEAFRTRTYLHQNNDEATVLIKRTLNYFIAPHHREAILASLMARHFPEGETAVSQRFYMTPAQIRELQQAGMIVGNHSVSHPVLSRLSVEEQAREIGEAFDVLDDFTGGLAVRTFCYPYGGAHSYTDQTVRLLENHGCLFSFDFDPRDVEDRDLGQRRQALPRFDCNQFPHGTSTLGPRG